MSFTEDEVKELIKAWLAISLAFAFARGGVRLNLETFSLSALTVGIGFLLHELGHKFVAQRYGLPAEFRAFDQMLVLAVLLSLISPVIFAAPGAVFIGGYPTSEENGKISLAGPLTSLLLALLFLALYATPFAPRLMDSVFLTGFQINSWLAFFNLLPLWNFDGAKILAWNRLLFAALFIFALALAFFV